jgi:hypothetical protein
MDGKLLCEMVGGDFMIIFEELEFCRLFHETFNPDDSF